MIIKLEEFSVKIIQWHLQDSLHEVISHLVLSRLDNVTMSLLLGHKRLLPVLDSPLMSLQLGKGLFLQLALLLFFEILDDLLISLTVKNQSLSLDFLLQRVVNRGRVALVVEFALFNAFFLSLLLVLVLLVVKRLLFKLLLDGLDTVVLDLLEALTPFLGLLLLVHPLLVETLLVEIVASLELTALFGELELLLRLALLHLLLDPVELAVDLCFKLSLARLPHEHPARGHAAFRRGSRLVESAAGLESAVHRVGHG